MTDVLRLPLSDAQRTLARFREEERAFVAVLEVLDDWRREELFRRLFGVYRQRMRQLRKLAGALLDGVEAQPEAEELRRLARKRRDR